MAKGANHLKLADQMKVVDWLRENWEKRVLKDKMTSREIADMISNEKGIAAITDNNVRGILSQVFPQWELPSMPAHISKGGAASAFEVGVLRERVTMLEERVTKLEKELGVTPLTHILPPNLKK